MASRRRFLPTISCALVLGACADTSRPPPVASLRDEWQTTTDATTDSGEADLDLGDAESTTDADICQRVDLLFVIDNSASMADEQASLVASFPGFIAGIAEILGAETDYHVGIVTTDENPFNRVGCRRIGALTTRTGGEHSSDAVCGPFATGGAFMTVADPLDDAFACTAKVGTEGSGLERPMDALASMLEPDTRSIALCNEGFLRDDALLVLTIITDEEDDGGSRGNPSDWYDMVVAAKGGDPTRVVVLSLLGRPAPNACANDPADAPEMAERIAEFTELFDHGDVADICAADYGTFFATSIAGIAEACDVVIPLE
jgi:hypothetical protein